MSKLTTIVTLIFVAVLLGGCITDRECVQRESGYFAKTKLGNSYFLSENIDDARKMHDGLIIQDSGRCTEWKNK